MKFCINLQSNYNKDGVICRPVIDDGWVSIEWYPLLCYTWLDWRFRIGLIDWLDKNRISPSVLQLNRRQYRQCSTRFIWTWSQEKSCVNSLINNDECNSSIFEVFMFTKKDWYFHNFRFINKANLSFWNTITIDNYTLGIMTVFSISSFQSTLKSKGKKLELRSKIW